MNTAYAIWTRPTLIDQVVRRRRDGKGEIALHTPDLATPWQALRLEQWLSALHGVSRVDVHTDARRVRITFQPDQADIHDLLNACAQAGCPAQPLHHDNLDDRTQHQADDALKRLLVAGIFGMQAMMFAFVLYVGAFDAADATTMALFRWLGLLAATPVVTYAAVPFFRHAWTDLRAGRAGIDTPIALAVILIYTGSMVSTLRGHGETWFDSACMLVFVLLLGRYLELRARHKHRALGQAASHATPLTARRYDRDGTLETVALAELNPGDCVHVTEGSIVPVDGVLTSDTAQLDTSTHTGESRPQALQQGEPVAAGSVALEASLELRVTRSSAASSLARLHALTQSARRQPARVSATSARSVAWFMCGIITLASMTAAFWLWHDPARALDATVAVLVVACPCAFALAAPATLTRAMSVLVHHKVLVTRPQALIALADVDHVLFDKTGTLTQPSVDAHATDIRGDLSTEQATTLAVALARQSSHPLARALAQAHAKLPLQSVQQVQVIPGHGICGTVDGRTWKLGRPAGTDTVPDDGTALWFGDSKRALAGFRLNETPRSSAADTVCALHSDGMAIQLASGDAPDRVRALADHLGIETWFARQSPEDKYRRVTELQRTGCGVLVVGDGSNDAAALAAADVSASLVTATDLARQQADLLLEDQLDGLVLARRMARLTRRTLRQNRAWGLTWNVLAVPLAAMGLIPPWLAVIGMSASSLLVVLNALRMDAPHHKPPTNGSIMLRERTA